MLDSPVHSSRKTHLIVLTVQDTRSCDLVIPKGELGTDHILIRVEIRFSLTFSIFPHCLQIVAVVGSRIVDGAFPIQGKGNIFHLGRTNYHV